MQKFTFKLPGNSLSSMETGALGAIMGNVKDNAGNIRDGIMGSLVDTTRGLHIGTITRKVRV